MANIKSAEKRNRQRLKRRERNQTQLSTMRTFVKAARTAITYKETKETAKHAAPKPVVADALKKAIRQIDKAAQKGVIARKAAARKISRLTLAAARVGK